MTAQRKTSAAGPAPTPTYAITGCVVTNNSAANEHTRDAVVALANAVAENAKALIAAAEALKGAPASMGAGIQIGGAP